MKDTKEEEESVVLAMPKNWLDVGLASSGDVASRRRNNVGPMYVVTRRWLNRPATPLAVVGTMLGQCTSSPDGGLIVQ